MSYNIRWMPEGVIWTFSDELTCEDVIQANLDIYGDPRFDNLRYQIVDISSVEQFNVTNEALIETAAMDEAAALNNPRLIVAVVAKSKGALEAAETYKSAMDTSSWKVKIFHSMEDAEAWIQGA